MYPHATFETKDGRSVTVRLATPEDYGRAIDTWGSVASEKIYLDTETLHPNILEQWTEAWVENGAKTLFALAVIDKVIVGGIVVTRYSRSPKTDHVRELGMWLIKGYRGIGLGTALSDYAIKWARENGTIEKILLGVWCTNTNAIGLYQKNGFSIDGTHKGVAKIHGNYVDEILMSLDLWK